MIELLGEVLEELLNSKGIDKNLELKLESIMYLGLSIQEIDLEENLMFNSIISCLELRQIKLTNINEVNLLELKCKLLRLSIKIDSKDKEVIDNINLVTPGRSLSKIKENEVVMYDDGSVESRETYNIHPNNEIESDTPILNDMAQFMINQLN